MFKMRVCVGGRGKKGGALRGAKRGTKKWGEGGGNNSAVFGVVGVCVFVEWGATERREKQCVCVGGGGSLIYERGRRRERTKKSNQNTCVCQQPL